MSRAYHLRPSFWQPGIWKTMKAQTKVRKLSCHIHPKLVVISSQVKNRLSHLDSYVNYLPCNIFLLFLSQISLTLALRS